MNMLYEGMKDKGSLIIVPSSALETMNLGVMNFASMKAQADASAATNAAALSSANAATAARVAAPPTPPVPGILP
jgi:hypothetical protein